MRLVFFTVAMQKLNSVIHLQTLFKGKLIPSVVSLWWILGGPYIPLLALYILIIADYNCSLSTSLADLFLSKNL